MTYMCYHRPNIWRIHPPMDDEYKPIAHVMHNALAINMSNHFYLHCEELLFHFRMYFASLWHHLCCISVTKSSSLSSHIRGSNKLHRLTFYYHRLVPQLHSHNNASYGGWIWLCKVKQLLILLFSISPFIYLFLFSFFSWWTTASWNLTM